MNTLNGIPFVWDIEEDNRLFGRITPFLSNSNNSTLASIATHKRFDEITFENKIGEANKCLPCQDAFYNGALNFKLLINDLRDKGRFDNDFFYYQKYTNNLPKELIANPSMFSMGTSYTEIERSIPYEYINPKTKKRITTKFKVGLNKRACLVNFKQFGFKTIIDEKNKSIKLYVEYIYADSLDKKIDNTATVIKNDYFIEDKYVAIKLETDNFNDFLALAKEIDLYNQVLLKIKNLFVSKINATTNASELDFLYENCPDEVIESIKRNQEISEDKIWKDIVTITKLDAEKWFTDTSSAFMNALKLIGYSDLIYYKFVSDQALVKTIYNNLDGSSIVNGQMMSNKMQFASFIYALSARNGFKGLHKANKTFKYGGSYVVDSDALYSFKENDNNFFLQQYKKETTYYENPTETDEFGVSTTIPNRTDSSTEKTELDQGNLYNVLDLVFLKDTSNKNGLTLQVPAIFVKALADEAEFQEIEKNIRLGFDIVAVVAGLITLATTANPGVLALALADVALATGDIAIQGVAEELQTTPEGQEFLATWEKIYMVGGIATALISAPQLVQSFYNGATKFIKFAVATKNYNYLNFARALVLSAYLEINIANFIKNTVRLLNTETEIVLATAGVLNKFKADKLFENGVLTVIGEVQTGNKTEEHVALIYKGEAIIKAPKKDFFNESYELLEKLSEKKKFIEACEDIINRRRIVSTENIELLGKPPAKGVKMIFVLRDELGNFVGQLTRSPNGNELYYKLILNGKEVDIKCYMKLLDDKYKFKDLPIKKGEYLLYGDFNIPKNITDKLSGLGSIMYEDGLKYFLNSKKYGKVDGTVSIWTKADAYNDYGGQSINLEQFWKAKDVGLSTEKAAFETFAGKQAKKFGFTKVRSDMDENIVKREKVQINFLK